jgi:hypothetical protein
MIVRQTNRYLSTTSYFTNVSLMRLFCVSPVYLRARPMWTNLLCCSWIERPFACENPRFDGLARTKCSPLFFHLIPLIFCKPRTLPGDESIDEL